MKKIIYVNCIKIRINDVNCSNCKYEKSVKDEEYDYKKEIEKYKELNLHIKPPSFMIKGTSCAKGLKMNYSISNFECIGFKNKWGGLSEELIEDKYRYRYELEHFQYNIQLYKNKQISEDYFLDYLKLVLENADSKYLKMKAIEKLIKYKFENKDETLENIVISSNELGENLFYDLSLKEKALEYLYIHNIKIFNNIIKFLLDFNFKTFKPKIKDLCSECNHFFNSECKLRKCLYRDDRTNQERYYISLLEILTSILLKDENKLTIFTNYLKSKI